MRRLLNWAREVDWLAVGALVLLAVAILAAVLAIYAVAWAPLAVVLGFGSLTLANLSG